MGVVESQWWILVKSDLMFSTYYSEYFLHFLQASCKNPKGILSWETGQY